MLQARIKEQQARSRQLEQELEEMTRRHAEAEAQWRKKLSSVSAETAAAGRKERLDEREQKSGVNPPRYDEQRLNRIDDRGNLRTSSYDEERLEKKDKRERRQQRKISDEYSNENDDDLMYGQKNRGTGAYHDEVEGERKRSRQHVSYTDVDTGESYISRTESSLRDERRSRQLHPNNTDLNSRDGTSQSPLRDRKRHEKSHKKSRKTRERTVDSETVITKTNAAVTEAVQVVRDDEVFRLSRGRIESLESEKSALMELNTSLQEENKALKQLSLSLQKGTGELIN